ncbi:MAG TPA: ATP-binding cassette domain-containing protein [Polyangia bacterium]|nr:ATP-binding cassette domain-containing protein [Polyangia bacterium]
MPPAIRIDDLTFTYPGAAEPVFSHLSLALPQGARCLLLGANGTGKSTLLRLVAGRHMIPDHVVRVLGRPAFHDTTLAGEVAFLGGAFPFDADIAVADILAARPVMDPARRARVLSILEVDRAWRMHRVSDGQRRRVQLLLDLERPLRVILLDEVTADLDVLSRADLLRFLREESEERAVTIVYASHVLEGLGSWGTHLAFLSPGRLRRFAHLSEIAEITEIAERGAAGGAPRPGSPSPLHELCEQWMRADRAAAPSPARPARPAR